APTTDSLAGAPISPASPSQKQGKRSPSQEWRQQLASSWFSPSEVAVSGQLVPPPPRDILKRLTTRPQSPLRSDRRRSPLCEVTWCLNSLKDERNTAPIHPHDIVEHFDYVRATVANPKRHPARCIGLRD